MQTMYSKRAMGKSTSCVIQALKYDWPIVCGHKIHERRYREIAEQLGYNSELLRVISPDKLRGYKGKIIIDEGIAWLSILFREHYGNGDIGFVTITESPESYVEELNRCK